MSLSGPGLGGERSRRAELLSVVVANALPVVGVLALGWSGVALLLLYWLELGIDSVWALVRALFAGRPPDVDADGLLVGPLAARRATLSVPRTGLRIYLTTLATLPLAVLILGIAWLVTGALLVGPVPRPGSETVRSVTLAGLGIFLLTGWDTVRNYFYNGAYREHNSQTAFGGLLFEMCTVFFGGVCTLVLVTAATNGPDAELGALAPGAAELPLLLTIVALKFASDLLGVYSDRLAVYFESYDREYGWSQAPPQPKSIDGTLPDAPTRLRPARLGRVLGGPLRLPRHPGAAYLGGLGLLVAALFAIGGAWTVVATVAVASVAIPLLLLCCDQLLRYGAVEYRVAPEAGAVVAYDRLLGEALWRIESWDERGLRVERTAVDALLGTETVTIEHADGDYVLPHVPDAAPVLAVFDRQPERDPGGAGGLGFVG
ncbi:DUF6498-containing protein [Haloarcula brevis]|uniref:DUF6498-containing protein n=1 Tax=Haloarcula brevis TaxID=3111453 RepID=UPI00300F239E